MEEFEKIPILRGSGSRELFELIPVGVAFYTLDQRIAAANPAFHQLLGYPLGELTGKHWTEVTHADDIAPQQSGMEGMLNGESFSFRKRYHTLEGETVWADVFGRLLFDEHGQPSHYLGVVIDCGKKVAAECAVRKSEALFRSLVENIPDGITRFDRDHRIAFIDTTTARKFGLEAEAIVGRRLEELELPSDVIDPYADAIDRVFSSGRPAQLEREYQGRHYSWRLLRENSESEEEMVLTLLHDITANRRRRRERRQRLFRAERLSEAGVMLAKAGLDMDRVLDVLVHLATSTLGDGCLITVLSDDGARLDGVALHHSDPAVLELGRKMLAAAPFRPEAPIFTNILLTGKPLRLNHLPVDFLRALQPEHYQVIKDLPLAHLLIAPMRANNKVLGLMAVVTSRSEHLYSAEDEGLLQDLADRAGLTLASAQLYQENLRQAEELKKSNEELERRVAERTHQLKEANMKLYAMATHDSLTSLANRRQFNTSLDNEVRRCRRSGRSMAVLMLDIDQFKRYNDHYGHQQGDDCLKEVAGALSRCFRRGSDLVARYGGEEFVAVLTELDADQALQRAEEVRRAVEACQLPHATSEVSPWVTVSVGLVCRCPGPEHSPKWWVAKADEALYRSKGRGRNCVTVWEPHPDASAAHEEKSVNFEQPRDLTPG